MVGMRTRRSSRRQARHALEPFDPGDPEQLGVGHDVRLADRNEIAGAEILSDLDLMLDRPLRRRAELAGPHRVFLVGQLHPVAVPVAIDLP